MKRLLLDNDGSNFFKGMGDDVAADVAQVVRECNPAVTTYLVCSGAGTCYWPTQIGQVVSKYHTLNKAGRHEAVLSHGLVAAHERGVDPLGLWLEALKADGKETFITYRLNDVHNPIQPDKGNIPRIRLDNPDCIVGLDEVREGTAGWMSYCLDYARDDVRQYVKSLIEEQIELYGHTIDGFQLDWMRFPRHLSGTPDEVWDKRHILTEFVADVRKMLDSSGRRILLSVRVPSNPAGCRYVGLDLEQWAQRNLIDMVVASPFLTVDWQVPIAAIRTMLKGAEIPVYACFDLGFGHQIHFPESLRGICTSLYDCEPDGIYIFNFPCWNERLAVVPYHWLNGVDDPQQAAAKPLLLSVNHKRSRVANVDLPHAIPVTIEPGETATIQMHVPAAALPAWRAMCLIESGGDVMLEFNGKPSRRQDVTPSADGTALQHRSEIFVEFVNHYRPKTLRSRPEDCRCFYVDTKTLQPGANQLVFTNTTNEELCLNKINLALW